MEDQSIIYNFYSFIQILPLLNSYVYNQRVFPNDLIPFIQEVMYANNLLYEYLVKQSSHEHITKDIDTVYNICSSLKKYIPPIIQSHKLSTGNVVDSDGNFFMKFLMLHMSPEEVVVWMSMFNRLDNSSKSKITFTSQICMKLIYNAIDYNIPYVKMCSNCEGIVEIIKPYETILEKK